MTAPAAGPSPEGSAPDPAAARSRDAAAALLGRVNYERRPAGPGAFRLDRVRALLAELGDPHHALPALHVAGTKGKGSVAHMAAAACSAAEIKTGLFTSPHLHRVEERFTVGGAEPAAEEFADLVRDVLAAADRAAAGGAGAATFFECVTACGLLHFARSGCELAVLEVGLGGRLDATNVCRPVACAVTNVSRDHVQLLGDTPEKIAREKAGVAKPGVPLVWGGGPGPAADAVAEVCAAAGAPLVVVPLPGCLTDHMPVGDHAGGRVTVACPGGDWGPLPVPPGGPHQRGNLAVAAFLLDAARSAGVPVTPEAAAAGVAGVRLPGRCEFVPAASPGGPDLLFDAAHNPAGAAALAAALDERPRPAPPAKRVAVIAVARDKDAAGILRPLLGRFDAVTLTEFTRNPRALPAADLAAVARSVAAAGAAACEIRCEPDPVAAWNAARRAAGAGGLACAAGSFYLLAELR